MITKDDLAKIEIRIGKILTAEKMENADKLLKLQVDFGSEKRQILTAMAEFYPDPKILEGKQMPFFYNLEPRTMRGEVSQGMIMAIGTEGKPTFLVPESEVPDGSTVL